MNPLAKQLGDQISATAQRLNLNLQGNEQAWRGYAAQRMLHLSTIVDEPGYAEAVVAEAVNVALEAAGAAVASADVLDRELVGTIAGGLAVGARALAGAA